MTARLVMGALLVVAVAATARAGEAPMPGDAAAVPLPGDAVEVPMPGHAPASATPSPALGFLGTALDLLSKTKLGGYVEDTLNLEYRLGSEQLVPLNILRSRLTLGGTPLEHVDFALSLVGTLYSGATEVAVGPYLPPGMQAALVPAAPELGLPGTATLLRVALGNQIDLQEAFLTLTTNYIKLRAGRQKYASGTGFAYNPIDLLNRKNPMDPTYELDGLDGILAVVPLPLESELHAFVRLGERFEHSDFVGKLESTILGWDVGLHYTYATRDRVDWQAIDTLEGNAALAQGAPMETFTRRFHWHQAAAEVSGELFGVGLHAEGGYVFVEPAGDVGTLADAGRDHERFLVGADYTFDFELYVLVEYLRLGQGRERASDITLNDRLAMLTGEILSVDRDTLFVGVSYPITDLAELAVYGIIGCNDPSALVTPWLLVDLYPGIKLSLSAFVPIGSDASQNGRMGPGGFARLRLSL